MVPFSRKTAIAGIMVVGCAGAGWTGLNGAALRASNPKSVSVEVGSSSSFRTPSAFGFAPVLALADYVANSAAYKARLEDPSEELGDQLAMLLARRFGLEVWSEGRADLTLRVTTVDWGLECAITEGMCEVIYRASLQLKDNRTGRILSSGDCENSSASREIPWSKVGSPSDNLRAVNLGLERATRECVDIYRTKMFSIFKSDIQKAPLRPAVGPRPGGRLDGGASADASAD